MRKCCCCISVHVGAIILGTLAIILCLLQLSLLIPYFLNVENFNPIEDNLNYFYFNFEKFLLEHEVESERAEAILDNVKRWTWPALMAKTGAVGFYLLISLLMVIGVNCKVRGLMLPYLIVQMLIIILVVAITLGLSIVIFFLSILAGVIVLGVSLLISFLYIYFWSAVQKSYLELGNGDWGYEPTPVKPIYNPHHRYNPSAPQHFAMD